MTNSWQPIATAPKDGTRLLCFSHSLGCYVAEWSNLANGQFNWNDTEYTFTPTHWMPLPDPPADAKETL